MPEYDEPEPERNYLAEAKAILAGKSVLLPEKAHLEALDEAHECQLIEIFTDLDALRKKVLRAG